jgi:hypothetical protein
MFWVLNHCLCARILFKSLLLWLFKFYFLKRMNTGNLELYPELCVRWWHFHMQVFSAAVSILVLVCLSPSLGICFIMTLTIFLFSSAVLNFE